MNVVKSGHYYFVVHMEQSRNLVSSRHASPSWHKQLFSHTHTVHATQPHPCIIMTRSIIIIIDFEKLFHNVDIVDNVRAEAWKKVILPKIYGVVQDHTQPKGKKPERKPLGEKLWKNPHQLYHMTALLHNMHKLIQQDIFCRVQATLSRCTGLSLVVIRSVCWHTWHTNMGLKQAHKLLHRSTRHFEKTASLSVGGIW